jgi:hypothetical protein
MDPAQPNTSAVTCSANRAAGTSAAAARPRPTNPPPPPPPPRPPCPPPPAPLPPPPRWLLVVVEGVGRWWVPGVGVAPRVAAARPPARATLGRKASGLSRAAPILLGNIQRFVGREGGCVCRGGGGGGGGDLGYECRGWWAPGGGQQVHTRNTTHASSRQHQGHTQACRSTPLTPHSPTTHHARLPCLSVPRSPSVLTPHSP